MGNPGPISWFRRMGKYNIPIVMYHSINDRPNENPLGFLSFSSIQFRQHLKYFKSHGFRCVTLIELYAIAVEGRLGKDKLAVLTFDDGFLDNFLVAADIMDEFGFQGTVFVNPDFADDGPVRNPDKVDSPWGQLNFSELQLLEQRGTFDIQSHTMSHNREFKSNKVVDFYRPEKFWKYYWLAWQLFPEDKPAWCENLKKHMQCIPSGYPIFEYGRGLTVRRFIADEDFIRTCRDMYARQGLACLEKVNQIPKKGQYESEQEWYTRRYHLLNRAKVVLEEKLDKEINFVCFPGGSYNNETLKMASSVGYKVYMASSKNQCGDNLKNFHQTLAYGKMVGLKRISFSKHYPKFIPDRLAGYWQAKLKVELFMGSRTAGWLTCSGKALRNLLMRKADANELP
ncbi:hypothetical protein ES706_04908 [subsurface metagenome]